MKEAVASLARPQSLGEEIANSVSHGVGMLAALAAAPVLVHDAARKGGAAALVGVSVFAATTVLLYFASTVYHALPRNRFKQLFQILDHGAIFLLIAGTYTPFALGVLYGPWGWTLLGLVWGLALGGILLKAICGTAHPRLSAVLYLAMGWLVVIAVKPLWLHMPGWGLFWLLAGGIAYTVGVAFFVVDGKVRYAHFVWHLFVLAGTASHFVAVMKMGAGGA